MVGEHEILVHRQGEAIAQRCHDFRLFDGINAEFAFEVLVHLDEFSRIAGMLDDHFDHRCSDLIVAHGGTGGRWGSRCSRCSR